MARFTAILRPTADDQAHHSVLCDGILEKLSTPEEQAEAARLLRGVGIPITWAQFRGFVATRTAVELARIDQGTARYAAQFGRIFANCESFAQS